MFARPHRKVAFQRKLRIQLTEEFIYKVATQEKLYILDKNTTCMGLGKQISRQKMPYIYKTGL